MGKMYSRPAILLSNHLNEFLHSAHIHSLSFEKLTGKEHPWEVGEEQFQQLRQQLYSIEYELRNEYDGQGLTSVINGEGAFWLLEEQLIQYLQSADAVLHKLREEGPLPTWKLTTMEMVSTHVSNMKQLIMAVAHDLSLLEFLQEALGKNRTLIQRQFEQSERFVSNLLEEIQEIGPQLAAMASEKTELLERSRITKQMMEQNELTEEKLGYTLDDLQRVEKLLEEQCQQKIESFRQKFMAAYQRLLTTFRDGESTQLGRASKWEMTFALLGEIPNGFEGHAHLTCMEREGLQWTLRFREGELGESVGGQKALSESQKVEQKSRSLFETEEEEDSLSEEVGAYEESGDGKKQKPRMAFMSRRGR